MAEKSSKHHGNEYQARKPASNDTSTILHRVEKLQSSINAAERKTLSGSKRNLMSLEDDVEEEEQLSEPGGITTISSKSVPKKRPCLDERKIRRSRNGWRICLCHTSNFLTTKSNGSGNRTTENCRILPKDATVTAEITTYPLCRFVNGDQVYYRPRCDNNKEHGFYGIFQKQVSSTMSQVEQRRSSRPLDVELKTKQQQDIVADKQSESPDMMLVETCRLIPYFGYSNTTTALIVTKDTARYRQLASSQLMDDQADDDHVLEIGCSTGATSRILIQRAKSWIGLDTSAEMIQVVQKQFPNSNSCSDTNNNNNSCDPDHIMGDDDNDDNNDKTRRNNPRKKRKQGHQRLSYRVDALMDPLGAQKIICTFTSKGPDTVFVDIGGNRAVCAVLNMLRFVWTHFHHVRQIVVKSKSLFQSLVQQQHPRGKAVDSRDWMIHNVSQWLQEQQLLVRQEDAANETTSTTTTTTAKTTTTTIAPYTFPKHPLKARHPLTT